MPEITVTSTPQSLRTMLGLADSNGVVWLGQAENLSRQTVYRRRADSMPDTSDYAFRHTAGAQWAMAVYGDALGQTWLWTSSRNNAVVYLEAGLPGV